MWELIVSVPDHCLSFYFAPNLTIKLSRIDPSVTIEQPGYDT